MARKPIKKNTKIIKKEESTSTESSSVTTATSTESKSVSENEQSSSSNFEAANEEEIKKAKKIVDEVEVTESEGEDAINSSENSENSESSDTESGSNNNESEGEDELLRTIFIKGLDYDINEENLRSEVEKIGPVGRINVPMTYDGRRNKGFAYVEFKKSEDADKLLKLNEQEFMGRKVIVDKAKPKTNYLLYTVFIKNLGFNTTRAEILEYFEKFGKIHNLSLPIDTENEGRNKGYCFIEYLDESIATNVVKNKHIINGRTLFLNFGQKNEKRNERRANDRLYGRKDNYDDKRRFRDGNRNRNNRRENRDGSGNDRFYNRQN